VFILGLNHVSLETYYQATLNSAEREVSEEMILSFSLYEVQKKNILIAHSILKNIIDKWHW